MLAPPQAGTLNSLRTARLLALAVPVALLGGALLSQYVGKLYPCEMCWWQRYPHAAATLVAIAACVSPLAAPRTRLLTLAAAALIAVSGAIGAFLTALYTFRLLFIVFWGEMTPFAREHLHLKRFEGGLAMAWPVAILAVLSFFGGWLQVPWGWDLVNEWIDPVAESAAEATGAKMCNAWAT